MMISAARSIRVFVCGLLGPSSLSTVWQHVRHAPARPAHNEGVSMSDPRLGRRGFIQRAAALGALSAAGMTMANTATKPRYRMGLQLYTVRDPMGKDAVGTLKQAAAL